MRVHRGFETRDQKIERFRIPRNDSNVSDPAVVFDSMYLFKVDA